ncbi:hypothetical protein BCR44DRAFT_1423124 [Catenaria anguillulae PL171]|uniref:Uncharacterized protein n=1 Tax=Catenaria anguillulae PL171 TaxID=765915 RepID=A0A1Y2I7V9_9FUNG|nr:hypothetical protein BCR44DRAFT_1423124 [Catenaria anguillulae PL171]
MNLGTDRGPHDEALAAFFFFKRPQQHLVDVDHVANRVVHGNEGDAVHVVAQQVLLDLFGSQLVQFLGKVRVGVAHAHNHLVDMAVVRRGGAGWRGSGGARGRVVAATVVPQERPGSVEADLPSIALGDEDVGVVGRASRVAEAKHCESECGVGVNAKRQRRASKYATKAANLADGGSCQDPEKKNDSHSA